MFKKLLACTALSAVCATNFASDVLAAENGHKHQHNNHKQQAHSHGSTADSHAPIGVMADHFHSEGEFMLSYRYKNMLMKGMRDGTNSIKPSEVVSATGNYGYMMTPTRMSMDMHMIGAMYGVSDDVTAMVMGHYMENRMDMVNRMGVNSKMETQGFGDTAISAMIKIFDDKSHDDESGRNLQERLHATIGLSLPTGSTDEKGLRMGSYGNLPYSMQLGSGTYDPILSVTYFEQKGNFSWGTQANAKIRTGKNNEGYRRGDEYSINSWIAKNLSDWASISAKIEGKTTGKIDGADQNTFGMRNMVPTFDPNNYGGKTIDLGFGINLYQSEGSLANHRLALEYTTPIYQDLNGPQMETQHSVTLGWQWSF